MVNKMKSEKEFLEETYEKHKPKLFFPIFNTVLGCALIAALIYLTIIQELDVGKLILAIVLTLMFMVASWYNSYFSKKKTQKEIYNLQEETEILINAIKEQKSNSIYEIDNSRKLKFTYEENNDINLEEINFDVKTRLFSKEVKGYTQVNLTVACAGLLVNPNTKEVEGFGGMAPCSVWIKKRLKAPIAIKGKVYMDAPSYKLTNKTIFKYLRHEDTYYDKKTGWLCFGPKKVEVIDVAIEVAQNVYLVLRDDELISVWVNVGDNLPIR